MDQVKILHFSLEAAVDPSHTAAISRASGVLPFVQGMSVFKGQGGIGAIGEEEH
jgi:hypothetical protein